MDPVAHNRNAMNNVEAVRKLNEQELKLGIAGGPGSWHAKYAHSSIVYVGGLAEGLTEGDVLSVFEQIGTITHINMVRDDVTKKPRGFCFLGYKDQRSTILAVDNFNGAELYGRVLRVDHVDDYKAPDPEKVQLLNLSTDASPPRRTSGSASAAARSPDRRHQLMDEEARKRTVMERLAAMRRRRAAEEAAEREGSKGKGADSAGREGAPSGAACAEASLVVDAEPEAERRELAEWRAGKLARKAERQLAREEREKRREDKRRRRGEA